MAEREELILASIFGIIDNQYGYSFDITSAYIDLFGKDSHIEILREFIIDKIRESKSR
ncbi:MAG: hypothetical protein GTO02_19705 [Candidatus Dadabacteria bacterium]|nr:hypothetical protein [Candidatus Dadabacteria bacterium]